VTAAASTLVDAPTPQAEARVVVPPEVTIGRLQVAITLLILVGPLIGVIIGAISLLGRFPSVLDIVLAVAFYAIAGHGVTAGYHRLFAHRSYQATRAVKIALGLAGSLAFEGALIGWVANHRRHHAYTDRAGDPHSPYLVGDKPWSRTRGALHAHVGWLFCGQPTDVTRWAPDLVSDPDLVLIDRLFPLLCVFSLGAPTLIGWAVTGTASGALGAFIWAGLVRVFVLQHATFAINSACHIWGSRPFRTRASDRATNFAPLAVFAMGENWHNLHHSLPRSARHGVERGQLDSTARLIRLLEVGGLVSDVRWPSSELLHARRRSTPPCASAPQADQPIRRDELSSARR
jgi:stearoyl-CoA desaturase (Delta-9 desaturase)